MLITWFDAIAATEKLTALLEAHIKLNVNNMCASFGQKLNVDLLHPKDTVSLLTIRKEIEHITSWICETMLNRIAFEFRESSDAYESLNVIAWNGHHQFIMITITTNTFDSFHSFDFFHSLC